MRKSIGLAFVVVLFTLAFLITVFFDPTSRAQNANNSTTTNRNSSREIVAPKKGSPAPPVGPQDFSKNTWELPEDAAKTKNPVQATLESIAKGNDLYHARPKGNCIFCHGETGSGNEANRPQLRRKPADLTNKERMSAMTDGEVFWKVSKGIFGIMPAGEQRLSEEERWHVVNYVRTLAKEPEK